MSPEQLQLLDVQVWGLNVSAIGTAALVIIMITMGLTLEPRDFLRVITKPRAAVVGLAAQLIVLPATGFLLAWLFEPALPVAVGLIILACCPSGATSNFFSYLARGDVALSVSLTALSGVVVVFTVPVLVNLGLILFTGESEEIRLPVAQSMLRIFNLIVLPVLAGMAVKRFRAGLARRIEPWATRISFAVILFTMVVLFEYVSRHFVAMLAMSWQATVSLNVIMMTIGFAGARLVGVTERQSRSICIEVGIQNYLLSVVIAIGLLKRPDFAIVPIVYLFTMYVTVFAFIGYSRYIRDRRSGTSVFDEAGDRLPET